MVPSIEASTTRRDALINYVEKCCRGEGFAGTPDGTESTLQNTFRALYVLNGLNRLGTVEKNEIIAFVNSCKNADSGFGNTAAAASDIASTYYACWILDLFDTEINATTFEWVISLQNESGGFANSEGESETIYATYFGIETLILNGTDLSANNVSDWLLQRQNNNPASEGYGGFATDGNTSNMWSTWAAMGTLNRLGKSNQTNADPLSLWINKSQNLNVYENEYGSFSSSPSSLDYSLLYTYAAITSLQNRGPEYLSRIALNTALKWVLSIQNEDGGFRLNSLEADSTLGATYYAFALLYALGETGRLQGAVPWEADFSLPIWAWVLIIAGIGIVAVLFIKKYYLD